MSVKKNWLLQMEAVDLEEEELLDVLQAQSSLRVAEDSDSESSSFSGQDHREEIVEIEPDITERTSVCDVFSWYK